MRPTLLRGRGRRQRAARRVHPRRRESTRSGRGCRARAWSHDSPPPPPYAGLVTRVIAFAIDAAIVNGTGLLVGVVVGLGLSVLDTPEKVDHVAAGDRRRLCSSRGPWATSQSSGRPPARRPACGSCGSGFASASFDKPLRPGWALVRFVGLCPGRASPTPGLPADPVERSAPRPAGLPRPERGRPRCDAARLRSGRPRRRSRAQAPDPGPPPRRGRAPRPARPRTVRRGCPRRSPPRRTRARRRSGRRSWTHQAI